VKKVVAVLSLVTMTLALFACAQSTTSTPAPPDPVMADSSHYSVLFENEMARVIRITYPPGDKSVMHAHPATCSVFLTPGTFRTTLPAAEPSIWSRITGQGELQPILTRTHPAGELQCGSAYPHQPENPGTTEIELVLLELKRRDFFDNNPSRDSIIDVFAGPSIPDAIAAGAAHYSVAFENDVVRLLRVNLGAGESVKIHGHPASCTIKLTNSILDDGSDRPVEGKARNVVCGDALSHTLKNVGKETAEAVVIEFKNRRKFKGNAPPPQ
jgi:hypothetical protein